MLSVGSQVKFVWWSEYRAPSAKEDESGHVSWHSVKPGDTGIILCSFGESYVVLFSNIDALLKIHSSMLSPI
jgi:hypothetical protein